MTFLPDIIVPDDPWAGVEPLLVRAMEKVMHTSVGRRTKRMVDEALTAVARVEEKLVADSDAVILEDFPRPVQGDPFTCGVQATFAVLRWFGRARSPSAVIKALGTTSDGTDEHQIRRVLRARGLHVRVLPRAGVDDLRRAIHADSPAIVLMDDESHWAVVYGYDDGGFYVADSAVARAARVRQSSDDFRSRWDRWAMVVRE